MTLECTGASSRFPDDCVSVCVMSIIGTPTGSSEAPLADEMGRLSVRSTALGALTTLALEELCVS